MTLQKSKKHLNKCNISKKYKSAIFLSKEFVLNKTMVNNSSGAASTSTGKSEAVTGGGNAMDEKAMPKDARVMISILKDMGIMEFEPRVINQLLEFSYRYISTVLEDSKVNSTKKELPSFSKGSL